MMSAAAIAQMIAQMRMISTIPVTLASQRMLANGNGEDGRRLLPGAQRIAITAANIARFFPGPGLVRCATKRQALKPPDVMARRSGADRLGFVIFAT